MKNLITLIAFCFISNLVNAQEWRLQQGAARDIAIGANGAVWSIGNIPTDGSYNIQQWNGSAWQNIDGGGVRIAVDPSGLPWVLNAIGQIWQRTANGWVAIPGLATDIAIGGNGTVWIISNEKEAGGYGIKYYSKGSWVKIDGGAVKIAVSPNGNPFVINTNGNIFENVGNGWNEYPGLAKDISVGVNGTVWIIGTNERDGGFGIKKWNAGNWEEVDGGGTTIAVDPTGMPLIVNNTNEIFRRFNANIEIADPILTTPKVTQPEVIIPPSTVLQPDVLLNAGKWIDVYEFPNYQGRKVRLTEETKFPLNLPFTSNSISAKRGTGLFKAFFVPNRNYSSREIELNTEVGELNLPTGELANIRFEDFPSIEIFEFPNYQGRSVKFSQKTLITYLSFPFESQNISIKFSNEEKTILYLGEHSNYTTKKVFVNSQPNLAIANRNISSLYLGNKVQIAVDFNGVLSLIHNNDCKRLYGNISYSLKEKGFDSPNRISFDPYNIDGNREENRVYTVFDQARGTDYICPFIYSFEGRSSGGDGNSGLFGTGGVDYYSGYPLIVFHSRRQSRHSNLYGQGFLQSVANTANARQFFYVDSTSFFTGNSPYKLVFDIVVKLGSAHKGCDACTDFTWDATMNETVSLGGGASDAITYIGRNPRLPVALFQFGPYRAISNKHNQRSSARNNREEDAINNFSGPEHPTYVQFSIKIIN